MSTFDSTKQLLSSVLEEITTGKIQLPDFQRGWIWDDEHVRSILVSIARSFPIGAVMMLDFGNDNLFQIRPIENVILSDGTLPQKLILDGQQRLSSLTQVLSLEGPVQTFNDKGREIKRYYYIDINKALSDKSLEDAFISVPADRKVKTNFNRDIVLDLSSRELELEHFHFPCTQILNSDEWEQDLNKYDHESFRKFMEFRMNILSSFRQYQLPIITLDKATSKEAVCLVFEKVNTGGVPLSVFELVTASFAVDGFNLRDDWMGSKQRDIEGRSFRLRQESILKGIEPTDFLQVVSLLNTYECRQEDIVEGKQGKEISAISAKRVSILSLSLDAYQKWAPAVENGFLLAAQFLRKQCIFETRDLPYRTQIVPLAAVLSKLGDKWREPKIYERLSQWFWCGVLGELYGGSVETRIANDFEELLPWLEFGNNNAGDEIPRTIRDAAFQESRLDTLRTRTSAAYKGLNVLILREGAKDFFWNETIQALNHEEMVLDIHHIFPRHWCEINGIRPAKYNSVVNKTPISAKANRKIGKKAPSEYLQDLQATLSVGLNDVQMNEILKTHKIPFECLRIDDFRTFYDERKATLLKLIEKSMGKPAQRDQSRDQSLEDNSNPT